ncbi:MAG: tRNA uridine-5-carboxymethylaminomethyl(34) synthesis GTPase MnmE [candidate division WOR-3 bacterium]|nr:MAG: tRNA uridine-5-carboxymethylaminomethyl(34) synthesis GTPase MnmE [candidate division WOR-3 bacterium]
MMTQTTNDTIVACATPAGYSSIGVIRASGEEAIRYAETIFTRQADQPLESNRAYFGEVIDPTTQEIIDKVVVTVYRAPHSYTGEDVVEIACHGNPLIIERILQAVIKTGARIAQRGEFTKRALLNGKIDLLQAEAVLDTVYAPCDEARKIAIAQYEGKLSEQVEHLRSGIFDLLVTINAAIDFSEEQDIEVNSESTDAKISSLIDRVTTWLNDSQSGIKIKEGYRILIMGRANVGKSTLFNRLLGFDRAITHETPGTTRDYLEDTVALGGLYLILYDTAGMLGKATGVDQQAQERTMQLMEGADLILLMFDGSEPMNEQDVNLYNITKHQPTIMVVNKVDLNLRMHAPDILKDCVKISAKSGHNIEALVDTIRSELLPVFNTNQPIITRERHRQSLEDIRKDLQRAREAPTTETMAYELRAALDVCGELTGKIINKEILDRIFDEFCIGK